MSSHAHHAVAQASRAHRTTPETMTATSAIPDRLLALGSEFTRHHDALQDIHLLRGANPAGSLLRHIPTTQVLARGALEMADALRTAPQLYHSPDVRAGMERATQLGALATLAADHLIDAVDLLREPVHPPVGRTRFLSHGRPCWRPDGTPRSRDDSPPWEPRTAWPPPS